MEEELEEKGSNIPSLNQAAKKPYIPPITEDVVQQERSKQSQYDEATIALAIHNYNKSESNASETGATYESIAIVLDRATKSIDDLLKDSRLKDFRHGNKGVLFPPRNLKVERQTKKDPYKGFFGWAAMEPQKLLNEKTEIEAHFRAKRILISDSGTIFAFENDLRNRTERAKRNYEKFHGMAPGTAKYVIVQNSSAGISGWSSSTLESMAFTAARPDDNSHQQDSSRQHSTEEPPAPSSMPNNRGDSQEAQELQRAMLESVGVSLPPRSTTVETNEPDSDDENDDDESQSTNIEYSSEEEEDDNEEE